MLLIFIHLAYSTWLQASPPDSGTLCSTWQCYLVISTYLLHLVHYTVHACILQHIWPWFPRSTKWLLYHIHLPDSCITINYLSCIQSITWVLYPYQLAWLLYPHQLPEVYPVNYLSTNYLTLPFLMKYLALVVCAWAHEEAEHPDDGHRFWSPPPHPAPPHQTGYSSRSCRDIGCKNSWACKEYHV